MQDDFSPSGTRADLIAAGLHLFGHDGFAATSTRALAARAGTNVASIAYHFGGKDGLRMACAEEVLRCITAVAGAPAEPPQMTPDEALCWLDAMLRSLVGFLTQAPQAADIVFRSGIPIVMMPLDVEMMAMPRPPSTRGRFSESE